MKQRMARKGPNAGSPFWGCSRYPKCKGTLSIDQDGNPTPSTVATHPSPSNSQPSTLLPKKSRAVVWQDSTLLRQGWVCQNYSISGSLRSISSRGVEQVYTTFVARQRHPQASAASIETRRVVDVWLKILSRGSAPPIHPLSELSLLQSQGFGQGDIVTRTNRGDLAPKLVKPLTLSMKVPMCEVFDLGVETDSPEEAEFVKWLSKNHSALIPCVTPQASFDRLIESRGLEASGCRRIDFLLAIPGREPVAVEIDGVQHANQKLTDAERDQLLSGIGIETIRVPTSELRIGRGLNLERVGKLAQESIEFLGGTDTADPLVWTPILLHRTALGIGESLLGGLLEGEQWIFSINDPTRSVGPLMGPYFEMLWALDQLWGTGEIAPRHVTIRGNDGALTAFRRDDDAKYVATDPVDGDPNVHLDLRFDAPPSAALEAFPDTPTVILRTAPIPVRVSQPPASGSIRVSARTDTEETRRALKILLQAIFAKVDFRGGQFEAIAELMAGRDSCVLLPTGAGKSLIYQLSGLCTPGRTLIIDPIVSLIEDQREGLAANGIERAVGITSDSAKQGLTQSLLQEVAEADAYFVFVAPERLQMSSFRDALKALATATPINLVVIDEAHCVSEWGHQFRTSYLGIGRVIRELAKDSFGSPPPLVALTGTASRAVLRDVLFQLGIREQSPNTIIRPATFDRTELSYHVYRSQPKQSEATLTSILRQLPHEFQEPLQTFFLPNGEDTFSGLVFVPTVNGRRNGLEATRDVISQVCPSVAMYSGSSPKAFNPAQWSVLKRQWSGEFKQNKTTCLVSTNAFGMGIDKPNIRWVVHYGLPGSIESYYQEVGRAGRNGDRSHCILILSEYDESRNSQLLAEDVSLEEARDRSSKFKPVERDDITTSLFFHINSFPGISDEVDELTRIVASLSPTQSKQTVEIPFEGDGDRQERALHRLVILGIVSDYLVEFGSRKFVVDTASSDAEVPKRHLLEFVERTQPGRIEEMRNRLASIQSSHHETIIRTGRTLIQFVYETVERSRRRSMREMLLTARQSQTDAELRKRVLEYLSEGDIGNVLEELVESPVVSLTAWQQQWSLITSQTDAAEWRASTARLLASYPDHPGLLLSRALSEVLHTESEPASSTSLEEFTLNLEAALLSATPNYRVSRDEVSQTMEWLTNRLRASNPESAAILISVSERFDVLTERMKTHAAEDAYENLAMAIVNLDQTMIDIFHLIELVETGGST